jgi:predicted nicotinamide N-methyase
VIGRARGINPEWVQREALGTCSFGARLLFAYLPTVADDYGRAIASPSILAGQLFFADDRARDLVPDWLVELQQAGEVTVYFVRGNPFLQIRDWYNLARPDRFTGRQFPAPVPTGEKFEQGSLPFDVTQVRKHLRVVD